MGAILIPHLSYFIFLNIVLPSEYKYHFLVNTWPELGQFVSPNYRRMSKALSNHEIVTLAVYLLGGESRPIDSEDVAVKADEIAPKRFTWRKYPNQINLDSVRKRLWDARKPEKGGYVIGSDRRGWLLTESGLDFAKNHLIDIDGASLSRNPLSLKEKQWLRSERIRMLASEAYLKFQAGEDITPHEAEAFFRLDDYVMGDARSRKITRILNAFGTDQELGQVVKELAGKIRKR